MTRKEAREQVFVLIFEKMFRDEPVEDILNDAASYRDIEPSDYIKNVFFGTFKHLEEIDSLISESAKGWSISRISKTALAAMRLCIFEMLYCKDIPVAVSINESVEIVKTYAGKEDASFVNGVLGTISRTAINRENM